MVVASGNAGRLPDPRRRGGAQRWTSTGNSVSRLQRAAAHVDAVDMGDGTWAHYADETSSWWADDEAMRNSA